PRYLTRKRLRKERETRNQDPHALRQRQVEEHDGAAGEDRGDDERERDFQDRKNRVPPCLQIRPTHRDRGLVQNRCHTERDRADDDRQDVQRIPQDERKLRQQERNADDEEDDAQTEG